MKIKKMLSCLILTVIFQNSLIIKTYASEYQVIKSDIKQLKFKTFNAPNPPPTHKNNTVEWLYNSLNQNLSPFSEEDTINVIKKSMQSWSDVSGINFIYKGITDNNINDSTDGIITIGFWSSNAYISQHGDNGAFTAIEWNNFNITEGHMILNAGDASDSNSTPSNLLELQGLITHEVGHLLAIAHSDNQESIMFADPYHSYEYQSILRSDDIQIASQLYPVNSNDLLTTVKSNLDIVIQSATFHSANKTSNIWAILEFIGTDSNGNFFWKLKNYGQNSSNTTDSLTTVRPNLDIVILSATFQSSENPSNIWAILEFDKIDSNGDYIWQLKDYGQN
ncbi:MAG: matrixin family metalloprotease [Methylococcaceae bacterium]|nr:matrixin family metalloprotease [Methylococcaceae bacterium]